MEKTQYAIFGESLEHKVKSGLKTQIQFGFPTSPVLISRP